MDYILIFNKNMKLTQLPSKKYIKITNIKDIKTISDDIWYGLDVIYDNTHTELYYTTESSMQADKKFLEEHIKKSI